MDGTDADILKLWDDGIAWLKDAGAEVVDISPAAHQIRTAGLLHRRPGRGLEQPRAL